MTKANLFQSGLDVKWWGEALQHAVYTYNQVSQTSLKGNIPLHHWTGKPVSIGHLRRSAPSGPSCSPSSPRSFCQPFHFDDVYY